MKQVETILKRVLGGPLLGSIDYWCRPQMRTAWGGPFNGQRARAMLFLSLIAKIRPHAIIETGTHRGTTTELMTRTALPIFTVESLARNYGFARARLARHRQVSVLLGDSRKVLRELFQGPLRNSADQVVFAYLDAHGHNDLPLAEEIDLIFDHCPGAVVMIDDFQVPFDSDYGYDRYQTGKALTQQYIDPEIKKHCLKAFFPSVPAKEETGRRRGCVVLAKKTLHGAVLASMAELCSFDG